MLGVDVRCRAWLTVAMNPHLTPADTRTWVAACSRCPWRDTVAYPDRDDARRVTVTHRREAHGLNK